MWTWGRPLRRERALRLQAGPPLPQSSPLRPGPGASPQRPTEPTAPPRHPSAPLPSRLVLPGHSPHPSQGGGSLQPLPKVPWCPLGSAPTARRTQDSPPLPDLFLLDHPGPQGPLSHLSALWQDPRGAARRKQRLACSHRTFFFSLANIFFFCKASK